MAVVSSSIYGVWECLSDFFELKKIMSVFSIEGIVAYGLGVPVAIVTAIHLLLRKLLFKSKNKM